jgi:hypothetical protein
LKPLDKAQNSEGHATRRTALLDMPVSPTPCWARENENLGGMQKQGISLDEKAFSPKD